MSARAWTSAEVALLQARYSDTPSADLAAELGCSVDRVTAKANALGLRKSAECIAAMSRRVLEQDPQHPSRRTRFQPGHVAPNKGRRMPGYAPGRSGSTQFKPGHVPSNRVPVGTVLVCPTTGYLKVKVNDEPGPGAVRWRFVHRLVWEAAHGPVPQGHCVAFKARKPIVNVEQITVDKLELLTRAENGRRNSVHRWGVELAGLAQLRGALERQINKRQRLEADSQTPAAGQRDADPSGIRSKTP